MEQKGTDHVTLLAIIGLTVSACVALFFGHTDIAGAAVGAIGGIAFRLYK